MFENSISFLVPLRGSYDWIASSEEKSMVPKKLHQNDKENNKWSGFIYTNPFHRPNSYIKRLKQFDIISCDVNLLQTDKGLNLVIISYVVAYNVPNNESNVQIIKKWTVVSIIHEWLCHQGVTIDCISSKECRSVVRIIN